MAGEGGETAAKEGAVVLMLSVVVAEPLAAGVAEVGFSEHVGAKAADDCTLQENCTSLLNPPLELIVTVELAECPADTDAGDSAPLESEKFGRLVFSTTAATLP